MKEVISAMTLSDGSEPALWKALVSHWAPNVGELSSARLFGSGRWCHSPGKLRAAVRLSSSCETGLYLGNGGTAVRRDAAACPGIGSASGSFRGGCTGAKVSGAAPPAPPVPPGAPPERPAARTALPISPASFCRS
eukprot:4448829-Prymnesium_polylepis.4